MLAERMVALPCQPCSPPFMTVREEASDTAALVASSAHCVVYLCCSKRGGTHPARDFECICKVHAALTRRRNREQCSGRLCLESSWLDQASPPASVGMAFQECVGTVAKGCQTSPQVACLTVLIGYRYLNLGPDLTLRKRESESTSSKRTPQSHGGNCSEIVKFYAPPKRREFEAQAESGLKCKPAKVPNDLGGKIWLVRYGILYEQMDTGMS